MPTRIKEKQGEELVLMSLSQRLPRKSPFMDGKTKAREWDRLQWNFTPFPQNAFCLPGSMETQQPVVPKRERVVPKRKRIVEEPGLCYLTEM